MEPGEAAAALTQALAKTTDPYALKALAEVLSAVAARMEPGEAARVCAPAAATLRQALAKTTDPHALQALAEVLSAVATRMEPGEAARDCAPTILQAGARMDWYGRNRLAKGLSAALTGADRAELSRRSAAVLAAGGTLAGTGQPLVALATLGPALEPVPCRVSTPDLVELLKQPTCTGPARRVILDQLGNRYHQQFADQWAFVRFAQEQSLGLDFTTPPRRLALPPGGESNTPPAPAAVALEGRLPRREDSEAGDPTAAGNKAQGSGSPGVAGPDQPSEQVVPAPALQPGSSATSPTRPPAQPREVSCLVGHTGAVVSLNFAPSGTLLASGSRDGTVKVWETEARKERYTLRHVLVMDLAFSPNEQLLASGGADGLLRVWDVKSGKTQFALRGDGSPVSSLAFSSKGNRLASGSWGRTVSVWDLETQQPLLTLSGHTSAINAVAFSPDDKLLASGAADFELRLWDAVTGLPIHKLRRHGGGVISIAFSPDGKYLATSSNDNTVKLWNSTTGETIRTFVGHRGFVSKVVFSPDGKRLASIASHDHVVRLWDVDTGREILTFPGDAGIGYSVAFSPDGRYLATGGDEKIVRVWDLNPPDDHANPAADKTPPPEK
jgi:WD40 repeat protein